MSWKTAALFWLAPPQELMADEDVREFYLGIQSEVSVKGYQRYKRKKRWR